MRWRIGLGGLIRLVFVGGGVEQGVDNLWDDERERGGGEGGLLSEHAEGVGCAEFVGGGWDLGLGPGFVVALGNWCQEQDLGVFEVGFVGDFIEEFFGAVHGRFDDLEHEHGRDESLAACLELGVAAGVVVFGLEYVQVGLWG